jgi:hypothetical protein
MTEGEEHTGSQGEISDGQLAEPFQPAFIVGHPRSGTSILRVLLDRHPEVAMPTELNFAVAHDPDSSPEQTRQIMSTLLRDRIYWGIHVAPSLAGDFSSEMRHLLRAIAADSGARVAGGIVHDRVDRLVTVWPTARLIHIIRDPRDVALSAKRMGMVGNTWAGGASWARAERLWSATIAGLLREQVHELRYEELVLDPVAVVGQVLEFLGLAPDAVALDQDARFGSSRPDPGAVGPRRSASRLSILLAQRGAGEMLAVRGYEPVRKHWIELVPLSDRLLSVHDRVRRLSRAAQRHGLLTLLTASVARRARFTRVYRLAQFAMITADEIATRVMVAKRTELPAQVRHRPGEDD